MVVEHEFVEGIVLLHDDRELPFLIARRHMLGAPDIALGERRTLEHLPEVIAVA